VFDANEVTCSVATSSGEITSIHDHVRRQDDSNNRGMFIWPPMTSDQTNLDWAEVSKFWIPYIQFRAIEIQEMFA
jgi:hypothetical protein